MSALGRTAVAKVIAQAEAVGVPVPERVPERVRDIVCGAEPSGGALGWLTLHPESDDGCSWPPDYAPCCDAVGYTGDLSRCTCWEPIYAAEQAPPLPGPVVPALDLCGDCAFRKGSPERADAYSEEALLDLVAEQTPFWCHRGMRRPVAYRHPTLGDVPADPADWTPPIDRSGVPYQADGNPGVLCAGWAARVNRAPGDGP